MKTDLKDLTITIPIKLDHDDRKRNLKTVMEYITYNFNTNIIICEQDTNEIPELLKNYNFEYINSKRDDNLIHRTKQLNIMAKSAKTPYIANYDADVLITKKQFLETMNFLRNGTTMVLPYAGPCWDVNSKHHQRIFDEKSIDFIDDPKNFGGLMNRNSVGGALFWNKKDFIHGGMENENFISWGFEDNERFSRFKTLGYETKRASGILLHLNHHRTNNSTQSHKYYLNNQKTYNKIRNMDKTQLLNEIKTWDWLR